MANFGKPSHVMSVGQTPELQKTRDKVIARPGPNGPIYDLNGTLVANSDWQPDPNTMDITWAPSYEEEFAARQANPFLGDFGKHQRPNADEVMKYLNAPQFK